MYIAHTLSHYHTLALALALYVNNALLSVSVYRYIHHQDDSVRSRGFPKHHSKKCVSSSRSCVCVRVVVRDREKGYVWVNQGIEKEKKTTEIESERERIIMTSVANVCESVECGGW